MAGEFEGKYSIVWNNRDVEMDLYADLDSDGDIADIDISNAHYVDNDEPIEVEEIEVKVEECLRYEDWEFWGYSEEDDDVDNCGMDCVDRFKQAHGIEF
jgi:hypothetical protein